ncbi:type VI secretion system lipoprotein TssJ [Caldimonas caldifontis]|uniref:Type VI secretion system lipoprotein TssJ n=1 Tax=Caldimonas caldifontis TaxID=1452508 RepID=A0A2S5SYB8_9BURK|nr:type VI secretion system lipoprotein TssJ [Caldimonas caldifontis]PPE67702.1 type VI secretion system lipoprotein TssJ [Caldimonas caldifontis]
MLRRAPPMFTLLVHLFWVIALGTIGGCASADKMTEGTGGLATRALRLVGLAPSDPPAAANRATTVTVRMHASSSLNVNPSGQPLSLVTRIYKLRGTEAFLSAPYETFTSSSRERELLGDELIETREIQMLPGQQREWREVMPADAPFLGVVALFRTPDAQRWRAVFAAGDVAGTGISLGLHACTMSVATGRELSQSLAQSVPAAATCTAR